jgi:hypothetical protein
VSFTSTSAAQATAFPVGVNKVRLFASTACHIKVGQSPTALTTDPKIVAGEEYHITVAPGEKVAAIRTTTSGTLQVTEVH